MRERSRCSCPLTPLPSWAVAVMVAVPIFLPVTLPVASTVATVSSLDVPGQRLVGGVIGRDGGRDGLLAPTDGQSRQRDSRKPDWA